MASASLTTAVFNRARLELAADAWAVAVVTSIPWSTTATAILGGLWFLAVLPTLQWSAVRREMFTAAGGLPVLFCLLAIIGMLWSDAPWGERLGGLDSFHRFLAIPLLLAQFRRSGNGRWVVAGFLASSTALLILSYGHAIWWSWYPAPYPNVYSGIPLKNYIQQSDEFQICAFGLAYAAIEAWRAERPRLAVALGVLAGAFLANIVYIATGRTAVAVMPVLLVLFGFRLFGWRGAFGVVIAGLLVAMTAWFSSHYLRERVLGIGREVYLYETQNTRTSSGERLELWKKSLRFIAAAPVFGHGTGSIEQQFRGVVGASGPSTIVSDNPHQQTLTVGIQLGLLGVAVMYAMWIAHLALFRGTGLIAWSGLVVVVQNVVASLFNSHLFDFSEAWIYVFGVGVLGGTLLNVRCASPDRLNVSTVGG